MSRTSLRLDPDEQAPGRARGHARSVLAAADLEHLLDDVLLLLTELVTNAAVHAGTTFDVSLDTRAPGLRVEVTDRSPGSFPTVQGAAEEEREGGRGMFLLDALATRWGTTHFASGKSVWFELERPAAEPVAATTPLDGRDPRDPDVAWLLGLPSRLEALLPADRLQRELVHRLGDVLVVDDVWLAVAGETSSTWELVAGRGTPPPPEQVARQRQQVLASPGPVLSSAGDLLVAVGGPGGIVGLLGLGGAGDREPAEVSVARLVAQRLALTVDDQRGLVARTRERGSLALLAEASEMFAGLLDVGLATTLTAQLVVPRFALWSAVYRTVDGAPRLEVVAHADEERTDDVREALRGAGPAFLEAATGPALATGPVFLPAHVLPGEVGRSGGQVLALPLAARGRSLGVLVVGRPAGQAYPSQDVGVLLDLARRAALAIDNARLYEDRAATVAALQSWLLPPELPRAPEVDVGARYVAAGSDDVGGDFYDVFALPQGGWAVAMGDVCGKGPAAASITGLARDVLRLLLRRGCSPAEALRELNEAVLELGERGRFCTAAVATLHPEEDGLRVAMSLAGHPQPVRIGAGEPGFVGTPGSLLGVLPDVELTDDRLRLPAGAGLVLYTDGVTERRRGATMFGDDGLVRALSGADALSADGVAHLVERSVRAFSPSPSGDDLAVLVVRATGRPPQA